MTARALVAALAVALAVAPVAGCGGKKRRAPVDAGSTASLDAAALAATAVDATPGAAPEAATEAATDAGLDAPPRPAVVEPTGVRACDRLQAVLIEALACPQLAEHQATIRANFDVHQQNFAGWPALPPAERKAAQRAAATRCQGAVDGLVRTMASAGCPR